MPFDLGSQFEDLRADGVGQFAEHVNPLWARVLKIIGFDREYVRASGCSLWDREGREYLDMIGGYAVCNIGRNHPVVRKALADLLASDHPSMVQFEVPPLAGALAASLVSRVGRGLDRVFFANSGAEGIEAAIKFAKCASGRPTIVSTHNAFHGLTSGALAITGCESFREGFGPFDGRIRRVGFGDLEALERELSLGDVAAFVVEPIQGKGVNIPPPGYLEEASRLCKRHKTLFVVDEVQTGVGRTGSFLAIDQEGSIEPDMVVLSKGLSGGFVPVGAVLLTRRVWDSVFSRLDRAIVHSSSFHMGSLAMVAALATLAVYDDERLAERARSTGAHLAHGLRAMQSRYEFMREIRQRGLMIGIEFGKPKSLPLMAAWKLVSTLDRNLFTQAVTIPLMEDHRILTQVAGHGLSVLKLTPPLTLTIEQADRFLGAFDSTMAALHRFPGPGWDVVQRIAANSIRRPARPAREQAQPNAREPLYTSRDA
ncbi:MAG: aspartate aminotransferase family protein [Phycisphaerales bacterium]|nr:aspartate aminotransferase family protein [Phycisphaerales bacterium]